MTDFDRFWAVYPRRVGKLAAMQAFQKARKLASVEDIIAGVERYIRSKPEYADWCHATTWLNQGRWMDEDDRRVSSERRSVVRPGFDRREWECHHEEPRCTSIGACHTREVIEAARREKSA